MPLLSPSLACRCPVCCCSCGVAPEALLEMKAQALVALADYLGNAGAGVEAGQLELQVGGRSGRALASGGSRGPVRLTAYTPGVFVLFAEVS